MRRISCLATLSPLIVTSLAVLGCDSANQSVDLSKGAANSVEQRRQECLASVPALLEKADALIKEGKPDEAIAAITECNDPMLGKPIIPELAQALTRAYVAKIRQQLDATPEKDWRARWRLLGQWGRHVDRLPAPFDKEFMALTARWEAAEKQARRYAEQAEKLSYYAFCSELGRLVRSKGPPGEKGEAFMAHARSAYGIRAKDEGLIRGRELAIGMPLCAVVASLGAPSEVREIASASGTIWSVWYRERKILIYLNEKQEVARYSR